MTGYMIVKTTEFEKTDPCVAGAFDRRGDFFVEEIEELLERKHYTEDEIDAAVVAKAYELGLPVSPHTMLPRRVERKVD